MGDDFAKASQLFADGRGENGFALTRMAIRNGSDAVGWVQGALILRDAGRRADARGILSAIVAERPGVVAAAYELAFLDRLDGEHRRAARILASALPHDPRPLRTQLFLAHMLYACGAHHEANATLAPARAADGKEREQLDVMFAFGRYIGKNPRGRALVLHDSLLAKNTWLETKLVADEIASAVAQKKPYALVRFGDGEGGVMQLDAADEARYRPLYDCNRQELIAMWFGTDFPWRQNGFLELSSGLINATSECDVIGVPYESWLKHEYAISSLRGISSLVNVFHAIHAAHGPKRRLVSQLIHVDLMRSGHLATIIAASRRISIISCLEVLPEALKSKFDLEEITFYRIPGEQGSRHILGETSTHGTHYPDRYEQLQAELARPHNGRLFLIAGGLLGKLYAATIRRFGGVAVDIGSVADGWAGHATRPGYSNKSALI